MSGQGIGRSAVHRMIVHVAAVVVHVVRGQQRMVLMRVHLESGQVHAGADQFFD